MVAIVLYRAVQRECLANGESSMYGSTSRTRAWRKPSTTRCRCAGLRALTWERARYRTNRRCCASAICWRLPSAGREALPTGACVLGAPGDQDWHRHDCRCQAPPSTKNKDKRRDPDMHQTKKGNRVSLSVIRTVIDVDVTKSQRCPNTHSLPWNGLWERW
jgi:hypothetical protein